MKIKRELKYATFEYDDEDKSITIETNSREGDNPLNGRIHLDKVYSFALLRFVIRIAQRNWYRKMKKVIKIMNLNKTQIFKRQLKSCYD